MPCCLEATVSVPWMCLDGEKLLGGRTFTLQSKDGVMLPVNVSYHDVNIEYSTAEILKVEKNSFEFRLTQSEDTICLVTEREIVESTDYLVESSGEKRIITSKKHGKIDDKLVVYFA